VEIKHITVYVSGYAETDPTGMLSPPTVWRQQSEFFFRADSLARHLQCAWDSSVVAIDKTYLIELVRDVTPLWDQRDKNYHNRDLKPKLWDEIGGKLNVAGTY